MTYPTEEAVCEFRVRHQHEEPLGVLETLVHIVDGNTTVIW